MKKLVIAVLTIAVGASLFAACGSAPKFEKKYEGKFYTFEHPANLTVEEQGESIVLKCEGLEMNLQSAPNPESKYGDLGVTKGIAEEIKKQEAESDGMKAIIDEINLNGSKALWIEGENKGKQEAAVMVIIPLDGAMAMFGLLKEIKTGKDFDLAKDIIKTLKITKPDYFKGEQGKEDKTEEKEGEEKVEDKEEDKGEGQEGKTEDKGLGTVAGEWVEADSFKVINPGSDWKATNESGFVMFSKGQEAINIIAMPLSGATIGTYVDGVKMGLKDFGKVEEEKVQLGENEFIKLAYNVATIKTNLFIAEKGGTVVQVTVAGGVTPEAENILKSLVIK